MMDAPKAATRTVVQRREKITSLPLYYEGQLSKKSTREREFRTYWAELRGTTLFFYSSSKDATYAEKLDLLDLIPASGDRPPSNQLLKFTHRLGNEEVHVKAESPEAGMLWTGYIDTVHRLEVPRMLSLLPGQVLRLQEVLEQERTRRAQLPLRRTSTIQQEPDPEDYDDVITTMPPCFYQVSRQEAIDMLENNPESGSLILRPGGDNQSYSITIRQVLNFPTIKHYRVSGTPYGYVIELEKPITLNSLNDVVDHFVKETRGNLKPFIRNQDYSTMIEVPKTGGDNKVEKTAIPRAAVAPFVHTPASPAQWAAKKSHSLVDPDADYLNEDEIDELNKMNLKDDKPPLRAAPSPSPRQNIRTPLEEELKKKLKQRRGQIGD